MFVIFYKLLSIFLKSENKLFEIQRVFQQAKEIKVIGWDLLKIGLWFHSAIFGNRQWNKLQINRIGNVVMEYERFGWINFEQLCNWTFKLLRRIKIHIKFSKLASSFPIH